MALGEKVSILFHLGRNQEALTVAEDFARSCPQREEVASTRALLLAATGNAPKAIEQIRIAIAAGVGQSTFHHAEYTIASAYALLGNNRPAVDWLRKTAEDGLPCYPLFEKDPNLNRLRHDPDFIAFMKDLKSQWEQYSATLP